MKIEVIKDKEQAKLIRSAIKANGGYCCCSIEKTEDTKCICKDFIENIPAGKYCHCGLYYKAEV